ncbi:hypothetical protein GGR52DRAFT_588418 [Hypoxylon sp. FL1284]|nr:hypothetical protein GGR52DRAFT_588418 [Hypoxylon sp. FL1284]
MSSLSSPSQDVVSLPPLPPGDWNMATMDVDKEARAYNPRYRFESLQGLSDAWHPLKIEYLDLKKVKGLKTASSARGLEKADFLQVVTHPAFGSPVLMKIASFPDRFQHELSDREVSVYKRIEHLGIAPRFLGHVTENGRVIGFLLEYLHDATPAAQIWSEATKRACQTSLEKLHAKRIVHGDAHRNNCLIRKDGSAAIIDFEFSVENVTNSGLFNNDLERSGDVPT